MHAAGTAHDLTGWLPPEFRAPHPLLQPLVPPLAPHPGGLGQRMRSFDHSVRAHQRWPVTPDQWGPLALQCGGGGGIKQHQTVHCAAALIHRAAERLHAQAAGNPAGTRRPPSVTSGIENEFREVNRRYVSGRGQIRNTAGGLGTNFEYYAGPR
jgi:hypothetical protein